MKVLSSFTLCLLSFTVPLLSAAPINPTTGASILSKRCDAPRSHLNCMPQYHAPEKIGPVGSPHRPEPHLISPQVASEQDVLANTQNAHTGHTAQGIAYHVSVAKIHGPVRPPVFYKPGQGNLRQPHSRITGFAIKEECQMAAAYTVRTGYAYVRTERADFFVVGLVLLFLVAVAVVEVYESVAAKTRQAFGMPGAIRLDDEKVVLVAVVDPEWPNEKDAQPKEEFHD